MIIETTHYKKKNNFINAEALIKNLENITYKEFTTNNIKHIKSNYINKKRISKKNKGKMLLGTIINFKGNNRNRNIFKIKSNLILNRIIFSILIFDVIFIIFPIVKLEKIRQLNNAYEITMLVKGEGSKQILPNSNLPDEIIINGKQENVESSKIYKFEKDENYVTVKWNSQPSLNKIFANDVNIEYIDLSNFDSSGIDDLSEMFSGCNSLKSVNFENFKTENVKTMEKMFFNCINLRSLDLSDFYTPKLKKMESMFDNDIALIGLDLSNFDTSSVNTMNNLFNNCRSLIYLNLNNFQDINNNKMENFFPLGIKLYFCIDENNAPEITSKLKNSNLFSENNCENTCFTETKKIILDERKCVEECEKTIYPYEFDNICYKNIPDEYITKTDLGDSNESDDNRSNDYMSQIDFADLDESDKNTIPIPSEVIEQSGENNKTEESENSDSDKIEETKKSEESDKNDSEKNVESDKISESNEKTEEIIQNDEYDKTEEITNDENFYLGNSNNGTILKKSLFNNFPIINENVSKFSSENFFNNYNMIDNEELPNQDELIVNIKEDIINGNLNSLLIDLINGTKEDLLVELEDISYQITTTENQKNNIYNNISTINLGNCEKILKQKYGIEEDLSLIILKIEYKMEGLLIPVIGYEIYHPLNYTQLDLNYCNDTFVTLNIPVVIDEDSAFKHDPNSDYYNDECYAYTTENGTDIILNDRIKEYTENNLSLCENNCSFSGYDSNTKKALCECETKIKINLISEIIKEENILSNNFNKTENGNSNIETLKCISLLFSKNGLLTNIGSYILIITLIILIISIIIFYKCGYQLIENNILDLLELKAGNKRKKKNKNKNEINIFNYKFKKGKNKKKKVKISNPKKKNFKKIKCSFKEKTKENIKEQHLLSLSKSDLKKINNEKIQNSKKILASSKNSRKKSKVKIVKKENFKEYEINILAYEQAIELDKRTFFDYYLYLIKTKIPILFSFYPIDDYNLKIIKICLFFISFDIYFAINTLFFNESKIHQIYRDVGKYNFSFFLPQIIYSFFISYTITTIIKYFSLSERNFIQIKIQKNIENIDVKIESIKKCLIFKYIVFYIISLIFLILFWFYLSSFCAVYKNTQIYLIINTIISFLICIIYIIIFNFMPCILRIISLKNKDPINQCLYKSSQILEII